MRLALLFPAALLAAGCDDPAIATKAAEVLEYGVTHAEVQCSFTWCPTTGYAQAMKFKANVLQDGSSIVSYAVSGPNTSFNKRGDDYKVCEMVGVSRCLEAADGLLTITASHTLPTDCWEQTVDLESGSCSGFNLSAFGVE